MKKIIFCLAFFMLSFSQSSLFATNPISPEALNALNISAHESSRMSIWEKAKIWTVKQRAKVAAKVSIEKLSSLSLILGALSLILLGVFVFAGIPSLILIAFLMALSGDIISIMVLQKTKNSKADFKKERRKAWFGLVFSLLTGLLPLALFGIILALLAAG